MISVALLPPEVDVMEGTTATMTVVEEADMVAAAGMKIATALLVTMIVAMGAVMITVLVGLIAMPQAAMTATAAAETIGVADLTTTAATVGVAMAEMRLLRGNRTAEVKATRTATIGTLVVDLRAANLFRWGALLKIVRPTWLLRPTSRASSPLDLGMHRCGLRSSAVVASGSSDCSCAQIGTQLLRKRCHLSKHVKIMFFFQLLWRCQQGICGRHLGNGLSGQQIVLSGITRLRYRKFAGFPFSHRGLRSWLVAHRLQLASHATVVDQRLA